MSCLGEGGGGCRFLGGWGLRLPRSDPSGLNLTATSLPRDHSSVREVVLRPRRGISSGRNCQSPQPSSNLERDWCSLLRTHSSPSNPGPTPINLERRHVLYCHHPTKSHRRLLYPPLLVQLVAVCRPAPLATLPITLPAVTEDQSHWSTYYHGNHLYPLRPSTRPLPFYSIRSKPCPTP